MLSFVWKLLDFKMDSKSNIKSMKATVYQLPATLSATADVTIRCIIVTLKCAAFDRSCIHQPRSSSSLKKHSIIRQISFTPSLNPQGVFCLFFVLFHQLLQENICRFFYPLHCFPPPSLSLSSLCSPLFGRLNRKREFAECRLTVEVSQHLAESLFRT